jgi:ATP-dependent phosphofructokinase / diphosphate-dependent phosphofructokinase
VLHVLERGQRTVERVKIAISTSGGDAPGLNAAIEGATRAACKRGWDVHGVLDGLDGLLFPERYVGGGLVRLDADAVVRIAATGGTILGAASDHDPLRTGLGPVMSGLAAAGIDALVCIGGDGTQKVAHALFQEGVWVVGAPKTIDNDLVGTSATFGFDSAVEFVASSLDRLRNTVDAHRRAMVVEVMGRDAGWIALYGGLAGGADVICIPEIPFEVDVVAGAVSDRHSLGHRSSLIVVAEGARTVDGTATVAARKSDGSAILGGVGANLAEALAGRVEPQVRHLSLGHLVRGGAPVATDRLHGLRLGAAAVDTIAGGRRGLMVAWDGNDVVEVPLAHVAGRTRLIGAGDPTLRTARALGICLGDR